MLPVELTIRAIQLCAAGLGTSVAPPAIVPNLYAINVRAGASLARSPTSEPDAEATVRDLLALGADFKAGPLGISGRDFATYGVTPASVFDACALAHIDQGSQPTSTTTASTVSEIAALLRRAFDARITDTIRPMSASYGALHSWHKVGQAIDFVPAGGVLSIDRAQIRTLFAANGIRLLELLGPGDPGHSNHWHVAFARPGQVIDGIRPIEGDEDWIVTVAGAGEAPTKALSATASSKLASTNPPADKAPPSWDVFALADWRASHGSGS